MKTIRIDDEVFAHIQEAAIPLVDDANAALRRLLGLPVIVAASQPSSRNRRSPAELTPHPVLRKILYKVLTGRDGSAARRDVLRDMELELDGQLTDADLQRTGTGELVWHNRASWERQNMVLSGHMKDDSDRGVWELSDKGWSEARAA